MLRNARSNLHFPSVEWRVSILDRHVGAVRTAGMIDLDSI
jgi:hypothetical protein